MVPLTIVLACIGGLVIHRRWGKLIEAGNRRKALAAAALAVVAAPVIAYVVTTSSAISGPGAWVLAAVVYISALFGWTRLSQETPNDQTRRQLLGRVPKDEAGQAAWMKEMDELIGQEMEALRPLVSTQRRAAKAFARLVSGRLATVRQLRHPRTGQFVDALGKTAREWQAEEQHLEAEQQWCLRYLQG
jgi:hypothetical protein